MSHNVAVGLRVTGELLVLVVPVETLAGAERDVGEQPAFGHQVSVFDVATGGLPRFDGIQKLAYVTR